MILSLLWIYLGKSFCLFIISYFIHLFLTNFFWSHDELYLMWYEFCDFVKIYNRMSSHMFKVWIYKHLSSSKEWYVSEISSVQTNVSRVFHVPLRHGDHLSPEAAPLRRVYILSICRKVNQIDWRGRARSWA